MSTSALLQQWYDEVWNKANEDFIDQAMDKDVIVHGLDPEGTTKGIENFKLFYQNFRKEFPVTTVEVQTLVSDEQFATGYCKVSAKNAAGKDVSFTGLSVIKFKDGKLVEGWNNFDFLKMYQQLGHILVSQIQD